MLSRNHMNHFQGGRITPSEYHAKHLSQKGAKCACGAPPTITARVFYPFDEVKKRNLLPPGQFTTPQSLAPFLVQMKGNDGRPVPHFRILTAYCCNKCRREFEVAMAKLAPSWAAVDWDYGPKAPVIYST